jgi:uncharacterized oxidoreductase
MNIGGNTIFITGGTSGLGLAFAEQYYNAGSKVIICGRREDRLKEIAEKYPGIITRTCDISDLAQRQEIAAWVIANHPDVNILMNNAGVQYAFDLHQEINFTKLQDEVTTNLIAYIHLSTLFAQHLATKPEAAIMNISSGLAFAPLAFMPVYCATKAAVHSFTMSLRHQMKDTGIKVFEIAPPSTDTELGHDRREDKTHSHGGMPVSDFIVEAMQAIEDDKLEAPIAQAKNLREKGETLFNVMNK